MSDLYLQKIESLKDLDIIKSIYYKIFPEEPNYDLADFRNSITGNHNYKRLCYYLAYDNKTLLGFCGIYAKDDEEAWLGWFGIIPEFRSKGYGTLLLRELEEYILKLNYKTIRLYTDKVINNNAYKMYIKNGYIEDGQYTYDFVTMYKSLIGKEVKKWKGQPLGFESEAPHHFN